MPELKIYHGQKTLPDHFYYQAQAFSRIFWYDGDDYAIEPQDEIMSYIVLSKGKSLLSYAEVLWKHIEHKGIPYKCYGLSGVMTFPFFRQRGYGGRVVKAATALIHSDTSADIALLWTAPKNQHFYSRYGWQAMPHMTTLIGDRNHPEIYAEELAMILFISDKGKNNRPNFEHGRLYVGEEQW